MKPSGNQGYFSHLYGHSLALFTDLYQLTMAYGYWKVGYDKIDSVFHHFFRRTPFHGGFTIACGLAPLIEFIQNFHFSDDDIDYLSGLKTPDNQLLFEEAFLSYLKNMRFTGDIDAIPEGTVVFPYEPLLRIRAPLIECQILETVILNLLNFSTLIATKAARVCLAAKDDPVLEFGARRAQGIDGALSASRAAHIGGCYATSNVLAGKLYGIPVRGTHSHSWVMAFSDELEAFRAYAEAMPNNCVFLVDTYDTLDGVKRAIEVGLWLRERGKKLLGIRLDSGDLADLSIKSRQMLDEAGFKDAYIVASNELNETIISELKRQGAQIGIWGVGTHLITAYDQPALDGVYKLSAIRDASGKWVHKMKLSEQQTKMSNPGVLQVKRFLRNGLHAGDVIYDIHLGLEKTPCAVDPFDSTKEQLFNREYTSEDLLVPIFREGKCIYASPSLQEIREHRKKSLQLFPIGTKRFLNPQTTFVGMERKLYDAKIKLIKEVRGVPQTDE